MIDKPGEIWLADLGLAAKTRSVLIISRHDPEAPRALLIYVPLTTQHRSSRYEVSVGPLPFLHQLSVVNVQGIGALVEPRLERRLGKLFNETMPRSKTPFALPLSSKDHRVSARTSPFIEQKQSWDRVLASKHLAAYDVANHGLLLDLASEASGIGTSDSSPSPF
jgi:mRNA interferase MazF